MSVIYAIRGDGLGTRLLNIIYARILAELLEFDLKVVWPGIVSPFYKDHTVLHPELRREVFSKDYVFSDGERFRCDFVNFEALKGLRLLHLMEGREQLESLGKDEFKRLAGDYDGIVYNHPSAMFEFMENEIDLKVNIKKHWQTIEWNHELKLFVDVLCREYNIEQMIAVHVRRGDIVEMLVNSDIAYLSQAGVIDAIFQRYTGIQQYFQHIDKLRQQESILICSQDRGVKQFFAGKYGYENIYLSSEWGSGTENQQAFIDLILLSRAKILVSPVMSFYSRCAAAVGTCQYRSVSWDVASLVEELIEIVKMVHDDSKRRSINAIIYANAARALYSPNPEMQSYFVGCAEASDPIMASTILAWFANVQMQC
jgi:hypothetical protein